MSVVLRSQQYQIITLVTYEPAEFWASSSEITVQIVWVASESPFLTGTQVIQKQVQNWEDRMEIIEKSSSYNSQVKEREWKVSSGDLQKVFLKSSAKNWSVLAVWKLLQDGERTTKAVGAISRDHIRPEIVHLPTSESVGFS